MFYRSKQENQPSDQVHSHSLQHIKSSEYQYAYQFSVDPSVPTKICKYYNFNV